THLHHQPSENLSKEKREAKGAEEATVSWKGNRILSRTRDVKSSQTVLILKELQKKTQSWRYSGAFPTFYFRGVTAFSSQMAEDPCVLFRG
ncbi:hypothetical protein MHYP_G00213260, partial [Metynnis hypsauchen]